MPMTYTIDPFLTSNKQGALGCLTSSANLSEFLQSEHSVSSSLATINYGGDIMPLTLWKTCISLAAQNFLMLEFLVHTL